MRGQSLSVGLFGAGGFGFAGRASIGLEPRRARAFSFSFDSEGTGPHCSLIELLKSTDRQSRLTLTLFSLFSDLILVSVFPLDKA